MSDEKTKPAIDLDDDSLVVDENDPEWLYPTDDPDNLSGEEGGDD